MIICHINLAKDFRGGERQTEMLIRALSLKGFSQHLICRKGSTLHNKLQGVDKLKLRPISKPFVFHLGFPSDTTIVHAHETRAAQFAYLSSFLSATPYMITRRVPNIPKNNFFTHGVYQRASRVVALSNAIKNNMQNYDEKITLEIIPSMLSHLTIDKNISNQIAEQFSGKFIVGNIGALVNHHKGQQYIIEAAKLLEKTHPDIHFLFLGRGKDEEKQKQQAKGLNNVTFAGFVSNVGDYLNNFDVFLFPSLEEGLGSILLDAMDFSKPIIATNVDGIPDIVKHEQNGILIESKSAAQIKDAVLRLYNDPESQKRYGEEGNKLVKSYTTEVISAHYTELYKTITK